MPITETTQAATDWFGAYGFPGIMVGVLVVWLTLVMRWVVSKWLPLHEKTVTALKANTEVTRDTKVVQKDLTTALNQFNANSEQCRRGLEHGVRNGVKAGIQQAMAEMSRGK